MIRLPPRATRTCTRLPTTTHVGSERWKGRATLRPRVLTRPGTGVRRQVAARVRALVPVIDALRESFAFDVIDAEFFFPDGPAAIALGQRYGVPVSIKARGADIHHWGQGPTGRQVIADRKSTRLNSSH